MAQVLIDVTNRSEPAEAGEEFRLFMLSPEEWKMIFLPMLVAAVTGIVIGIAPGAEAPSPALWAMNCRKRWRAVRSCTEGLHRGAGGVRGANHATTGGAMIPLITLGVPGDAVTAVMLGAFMLVGIKPGPTLFQEYGTEMQTFFLAFIVMQF